MRGDGRLMTLLATYEKPRTASEVLARQVAANSCVDALMCRYFEHLNRILKESTMQEKLKESTMQEKLIPFDLEAAKKNPERVRFSWGGAPSRISFNDPTAVVNVADAEGARHCYDYKHFDRLRLVAVQKTKRYKTVQNRFDGSLMLGVEHSPAFAREPDSRVSDVTFDKATGIVTVTYYEWSTLA